MSTKRAKFRPCPKCGSDDLLVRYHKKHTVEVFDWGRNHEVDGCDKPQIEGIPAGGEHLFVHCRCCQYQERRAVLRTKESQ